MNPIKQAAPTQPSGALDEILTASINITGADYGHIQMVSPEGDALEIVAQHGFDQEFLDHFQRVPLRAAESGHRIMIRDVETDPAYATHREIARKAGFRAVQSTPIISRDGQLLGMFSTHFKQPRLPDEKYLHTLDLYVLQVAHLMEAMRAKAAPKNDSPAGDKRLSLRMLDTLPFFADLTNMEKTELLEVARFRHFQRGEMIFRIGDPVTHLNWVCVGAVQKYRETRDGNEVTVAIRVVGDLLFDLDSTQDKRVRTINARALHTTTLLTVPVGWIDAHLESWDHLARKFINVMAQREWEAQLETEHQSTFTATQIVACFLQHVCVTHHLDPRGFILPYTKSVIASRLGMQLESLSRVLPKLREYGIIVQGKQVSFVDIGTAQAFSCGHCSVEEECPTHKAMQRMATSTPKKLESAN